MKKLGFNFSPNFVKYDGNRSDLSRNLKGNHEALWEWYNTGTVLVLLILMQTLFIIIFLPLCNIVMKKKYVFIEWQ